MPTRLRQQSQEPEKPAKIGITSVDAAALFLSDGRTTDPTLAAMIDEAESLPGLEKKDYEALERGELRDMMGFDFKIKIAPAKSKLLVSSKEGPKVRTHAKVKPGEVDDYGNIISEELIGRLVQACVRLKEKWDAANEKGK